MSSLRWIGRTSRVILGLESLNRGRARGHALPLARPRVEHLEVRIVPAQMVWTNAVANNFWNQVGNWVNLLNSSDTHVPTTGDYVLFEPNSTLAGVNADCILNISRDVDRIIMDAGYTSTLTITGSSLLTTTNQMDQYGFMVIGAGSEVDVGDFMTVNGAVNVVNGGALVVEATLYMNYTSSATGLIVASATDIYGPISEDPDAAHVTAEAVDANAGSAFEVQDGAALSIDAVFTDYEGDLLVDDGGAMEIDEDFSQLSGTITIADSGALSFYSADPPTFAGTIDMTSDAASPSLSADTALDIAGGTLNVSGDYGVALYGDVNIYDGGALNVAADHTLTMVDGSLTIGADGPGGTGTGGTLDLDTGSELDFPSSGGSSTFVVTDEGVVDMHHALIEMYTGRVSYMEILDGGVLNTYGASVFGLTLGDNIGGNLHNSGLINFAGSLHSLTLDPAIGSGGYTQGSTGTLTMRLSNTPDNDVLSISGSASLDGTLDVDATGSISGTHTWDMISLASAPSGDFGTKDLPGSSPWAASYTSGNYRVSN